MRNLLFSIFLMTLFATSITASKVEIGGSVYHLYSNSNLSGIEPSTQVVFLDVAVELDSVEVPFDASLISYWAIVQDSINAGHLVASLWERKQFETVTDTIALTGLVAVVERRGALYSTQYSALRIICSYDLPECQSYYELPDSVAASIGADTTYTESVITKRFSVVFEQFNKTLAVGDTIYLTQEKFDTIKGD